jgi:hypothetical protein
MNGKTKRGIRIRRYIKENPTFSNRQIADLVGCAVVTVNSVRMAEAKSMRGAIKRVREDWNPPTLAKITQGTPYSLDCVTLDCASRVRKIGAVLCDACDLTGFQDRSENRASEYTNSLAGAKRKVYKL